MLLVHFEQLTFSIRLRHRYSSCLYCQEICLGPCQLCFYKLFLVWVYFHLLYVWFMSSKQFQIFCKYLFI